jgi:hypothetical protein
MFCAALMGIVKDAAFLLRFAKLMVHPILNLITPHDWQMMALTTRRK